MKKSIAIAASSVLLLLVTACNTDNAGGANTTGNNGITPEAELLIKASNYQFDQQEYHLKKDVPVKITFKNDSGYHGVLIPGLRVQLDQKNDSTVIVPTEAGEYEVACSIMCGSGHGSMVSTIIVE